MSENITIRPTTLDDILALRTMHAQSWLDTYPNDEHGVTREWVAERVAGWLTPEAIAKSRLHFEKILDSPQHLHQIALHGLEIVGMVHASNLEGGQHLEALYVEKGQKGTGLAQRLMDMAIDWYDPARIVDLEVMNYNDRAIKFYEKYGFVKKPGSENLFLDVMPVVGMERKGEYDV